MPSLLFTLAASASAPPAATPSIAHALLGAALFPTNATIFANHRQLKGKAKTVPLPKRLQKTYPACSGHADEVAGKRERRLKAVMAEVTKADVHTFTVRRL